MGTGVGVGEGDGGGDGGGGGGGGGGGADPVAYTIPWNKNPVSVLGFATKVAWVPNEGTVQMRG